jgi:predicted metal-dependent hydrolase
VYPQAWKDYLIEFHGPRDYFECHEILEEYWKEAPKPERRQIWVGLIQLAVGLYHQRRGNFSGAAKMLHSANQIFTHQPDALHHLGLDSRSLNEQVHRRMEEVKRHEPYYSICLPIADEKLLHECQERCKELGYSWGQPSPQAEELIHRHTLRDRSQVIEERNKQLKLKGAGSEE